MEPVRVTHVVHDFEGGGLETLVAEMARGFDSARVATSVISLSGRIGRLGRELDRSLHHMIAVKPIPLISMIAPIGLARAIRRTRAEVVHIHSGVWLKGAVAARLARVNGVVFTEHGREHDDPPLSRWLDRRAARLTDAVVAVSSRLEGYLRTSVGVPADRLVTIENGVDTTRFAPAEPSAASRNLFDIPRQGLVVGSVGRLEPVKAYERLLKAVAAVRTRGNLPGPIYVLLCGDGSQRQPLIDLAESLGLGGFARFPGWIGDPADAYRMMDVFVLPSISEGLSVSLIEAMSSGITPVVTPVGANREVLGSALAGQVVDGTDPEGFARTLGATLSDTRRRAELSRIARETVVANFSQTKMLGAYTALYERLVRRNDAGSWRALA